MFEQLRLIPNQLTALRLLILPLMWASALFGGTLLIGIGLSIGLVTDLIDGAVARALNQTSDFGSRFDSLTDQLLQLSAIVWVMMLIPEIFRENSILSIIAISTYLTSLAVGLIKFRRIANLHLYISKFGGLFLYIFLIHAFTTGQYSALLLWIAGITFILSSAETLILQLTQSQVDEHIGSIFLRYIDEDHPIRDWLARLP